MSFARTALIPAFLLTALLWGIVLLTESDPVLGVGIAHAVMKDAAIVATAVFAVMLASTLILSLASSLTGTPATGFQRVIVYALLTFTASFATLRYFGFDLTAVLTTSAIVTAAVGFAMQPTLSSMIAGLALHADRAVHVGDCVLLDNETVRIESMNWRASSLASRSSEREEGVASSSSSSLARKLMALRKSVLLSNLPARA